MKAVEFRDYCDDIVALVGQCEDITFAAETNALLQKVFAIGAASEFEVELCLRIKEFVNRASSGNARLVSFVDKASVSRHYHSWFDWDATNANKFFSLFGIEFRNYMRALLDADEQLHNGERAFMKIGGYRNKIVHEDFLSFSFDKTVSEMEGLYQNATLFVELFPKVLIDYEELAHD